MKKNPINKFQRAIILLVLISLSVSLICPMTVQAANSDSGEEWIRITVHSCKIRSSATFLSFSNIVGYAYEGETFRLLSDPDAFSRFFHIEFKGRSTYVSKDVAELVEMLPGESETESPTEAPTEAPTEKPTESPTEAETMLPGEAETIFPCYGIVVGSDQYGGLKVRTRPTTQSESIAKMPDGTTIRILEKTSNNWFKIQYGPYDEEYFVSASFVEVRSDISVATAGFPVQGIVSGTGSNCGVNVRVEPSTSSRKLGKIPEGTQLTVVGKTSTGWLQIYYEIKDTIAYVSSDYVKFELTGAPEAGEVSSFSGYGRVVNYPIVNIRPVPGTHLSAITRVIENGVLRVLETPRSSGFVRVEANGLEGYIHTDYLAYLSQSEYSALPKGEVLHGNVIAMATTKITTSSSGGRANIATAASLVNGQIIQPGETFDYYGLTHPAGLEYELAPVYSGGELVQGRGGGLCQVSSTIYAAIYDAVKAGVKTGISVTARFPHSGGRVGYVTYEREAATGSYWQNFAFRNVNDYAVKVIALCNLNNLTVTVKIVKV